MVGYRFNSGDVYEMKKLISINLNGTNGRIINVDSAARNIDNAVWSPDGKKIAYTAMSANGMASTSNGMFIIMNADGSSPQNYRTYLDYKNYNILKNISWPGKKPLGYKVSGAISTPSTVKKGKALNLKATFINIGSKTVTVSVKQAYIKANKDVKKNLKAKSFTIKPGKSYSYTVGSYMVSKKSKSTSGRAVISGSIPDGSVFSFDKSFKVKK